MKNLYEAWAADAQRRGLVPKYIEQQRTRVAHLSGLLAGETPTADDIRRWLAVLQSEGMPRPKGPSKPCGPKTLNNHLAGMRAFFHWCKVEGLIAADPTHGIRWAKARKVKGRVLSAPQAFAIFEAARQDEQFLRPRCRDKQGRVVRRSGFYRVLLSTGMRAGAAASLRVRDFDLTAEPPRIIVRAEYDKSGQERQLIISAADRDWFARDLRGRDPGEVAYRRPHHKVLSSDAAAAGVPVKDSQGRGVGFHCFRRWYGSEMDRQGFSIEQIRERLGHRTILSTQGYLVRQLEEQQGVAETLSGLSGGPIKESDHNATKGVDRRSRIAEDVPATNGPPQQPSENRGERPAPAVCRYSNGAGPPRSFGTNPPGIYKRSDRVPQATEQGSRNPPQDLNLRPNPGENQPDRISLLHKIVDLLNDPRP